MASTGHSGSHKVQSMHSSGSITRKLGPSWKQSTGHTSTQSMYLHLMQLSVTTNAMIYPSFSTVDLKYYSATALSVRPRPRALQFGEMMIFSSRAAIGEVLTQCVFAARECQFRPRNLRFVVQGNFQALHAGRKFRLEKLGA